MIVFRSPWVVFWRNFDPTCEPKVPTAEVTIVFYTNVADSWQAFGKRSAAMETDGPPRCHTFEARRLVEQEI